MLLRKLQHIETSLYKFNGLIFTIVYDFELTYIRVIEYWLELPVTYICVILILYQLHYRMTVLENCQDLYIRHKASHLTVKLIYA